MSKTVLGPVDPSQLGFTLTHEHIADGPYVLKRWLKSGRSDLVAKAVDKVNRVRFGCCNIRRHAWRRGVRSLTGVSQICA